MNSVPTPFFPFLYSFSFPFFPIAHADTVLFFLGAVRRVSWYHGTVCWDFLALVLGSTGAWDTVPGS